MLRDRVVIVVASLLLGTSGASAETVLTGFAGLAFGGATERSQGTYGASLAFFGRVTGFEAEFGITPDFFGAAPPGQFFSKNDVVTLTGSLLVVVPRGPVRVYGAVGAGLLKTRLADSAQLLDVNSNDFGINVGGGILGYLGETVGLRLDVRYFRSLSDVDASLDLGTLDFWRAVGGVSLRF
jgi:Outer membrane protein beta-barrel domain